MSCRKTTTTTGEVIVKKAKRRWVPRFLVVQEKTHVWMQKCKEEYLGENVKENKERVG